MSDSSIKRYAMWLFSRYDHPHESLAEIFDMVKAKNPISSQDFTYPMFLDVFKQWQANQHNRPADFVMDDHLKNKPPIRQVNIAPADAKADVVSAIVVASDDLKAAGAKQVASLGVDAKKSEDAEVTEPTPLSSSSGAREMLASAGAAKVEDYIIISEFMLERFIEKVKDQLALGWSPLGGISRSAAGSGPGYYLQAMVLYAGHAAVEEPAEPEAAPADAPETEASEDKPSSQNGAPELAAAD